MGRGWGRAQGSASRPAGILHFRVLTRGGHVVGTCSWAAGWALGQPRPALRRLRPGSLTLQPWPSSGRPSSHQERVPWGGTQRVGWGGAASCRPVSAGLMCRQTRSFAQFSSALPRANLGSFLPQLPGSSALGGALRVPAHSPQCLSSSSDPCGCTSQAAALGQKPLHTNPLPGACPLPGPSPALWWDIVPETLSHTHVAL